MKLRIFLLLFIVFVSCAVNSHDASSSKRSRYEALKKQKEQERHLGGEGEGGGLPTAAQQAEMEEELRKKMGGQANVDAAKRKLADYVASVGGEEGLKLRIEKIGQEAVQQEIHNAVHGVSANGETFMTQLSMWIGLLVLLALPITRNEIVSALTYLQELFAVDRRSVLCFRVCMGFVIVLDALQRITEAPVFYSEFGVYPRELAFEEQAEFAWSLYFANGHVFWAYFLLGLTIVSGLCMVVGYRSRAWSVVAWVLLSSLHVRNPHVCNVGDTYLRICLLWASFLPLSDLLSVDNYLVNRSRASTATVTTTTVIDAIPTTPTTPSYIPPLDTATTTTINTPPAFLSDDFAPTPTNVQKKEVLVVEGENSSSSSSNRSSGRREGGVGVVGVYVEPSFVVGSLAAVGLLLQLVWFYIFTAQTQESAQWNVKDNYSAAYYLLSAPTLTHPSAEQIIKLAHDAQWSTTVLKILRGVTVGTYLLERWGVLLLLAAPLLCLLSFNLSPIRDLIRSLVLLALTVLNVALLFTVKLGPLPVILLASQTLFTPSWVFTLFAKCTPAPSVRLAWAWRLQTPLSSPLIQPLQGGERGGKTVVEYIQPVYLRPRSWLSRLFCVMLIAHTAWLNFADTGAEVHEIAQDVIGHRQVWHIFPEEPDRDVYVVMPAKIRGQNEQFDMQQAFGRKEVKLGFFPLIHLDNVRPHLSSPFYDSHRWTTYMMFDRDESVFRVRQLAIYICNEWNKVNHGSNSLETLEFHWVAVKVKQPKQALTGAKKLVEGTERFYDHVCGQ